MMECLRQALEKRGRVWGQPPQAAERTLLPDEHPVAMLHEGSDRFVMYSGAYRRYAPPAE